MAHTIRIASCHRCCTIEYDEVQIPDSATTPLDAEDKLASAGVVLTTSFEAIYTMQMNNTCAATLVNAECVAVQCVAADAVRSLKLNVRSNVTLNYLSVVTLVFWLIITIAKAVMLLRRNHASTVDSYVMLRWFLTACSVLASTFFFLLFAIAVYWTLTFKGQCVLRHSSRPPRPYERALSSLECSLSCSSSRSGWPCFCRTTLFTMMPKLDFEGQVLLGFMPFQIIILVLFICKVRAEFALLVSSPSVHPDA